MRFPLLALVALLLVTSTTAAGAGAQQSAPANSKPSKVLTLVGCVAPDPNHPGAFTLSDTEEGTSYRLTGTSVSEFAGRRVQVSGPTPKRLRIVGGLYPSPNIAAQGGDPVKAAMAATEPNAMGIKPLSEFNVKSVRSVSGNCPE